MSLLHQIQESIVDEKSDLSSILLKLHLLAARLNSNFLEEWVKHETEGYPNTVEVPSYRIVNISYKGSFAGPMGAAINNAQIPPYLVEKYTNDSWTQYEVREGIGAVEEMIKQSANGHSLGIDASNLLLLLQGKIYPEYTCIDISGHISPTGFHEIQQTVRSRVLELTIELERAVPGAIHVAFNTSGPNKAQTEQVQQISQQIIYGDVTTAVAGASESPISISVVERNDVSLIEFLTKSGIPESDATELTSLMQTEEPESPDEPFGEKAKDWIAENIKKAAKGTWSIGISVASKVLHEAALKYYGL